MKNLKRKLLVLLLSAVCVTAGAVGLAACNTGDNSTDSALYTLYLSDTQNGTTMTYTEWLEQKLTAIDPTQNMPHIGENGNWWVGDTDLGVPAKGPTGDDGSDGSDGSDGRGISSVGMLDGKFIIFYDDGTYEVVKEATNLPLKILTAKAVDQNNDPVVGAYLRLYYYDTKEYKNVEIDNGVTGENGLVKFIYEPKKDITYKIGLSDYGATETAPSVPEDYEICEISYTVPKADSSPSQEVEISFKNVAGTFSNAVNHNKIVDIPYTRVFNETTQSVIETNNTTDGSFTVQVKANVYTYLSFLPYVSPNLNVADDPDLVMRNATQAASGKYRFTITGVSNAKLSYFVGSKGYMVTDENGIPIPATPDEDGVIELTQTSITLNDHTKLVRGDKIFGILAESDGAVTLTVTRTGDSDEIPDPVIVPVIPPANLATYPNREANQTLTLMPVNGAFLPVYNQTDGYWHVNSADGPVLLVMLKNSVSRYMELSLQKYPKEADLGEGVLHFVGSESVDGDFDEKGNPLKKYDYNALLEAYCDKYNTDGVYGVDENMHTILTKLAEMGIGVESQNVAPEYRWLLACYYYAPQGGLPVRGEGTIANPYVIAEGNNLIPQSGVMSFSIVNPGVYSFKTSDTLTFGNDITTYTDKGTVYAIFKEKGNYTINFTSSSADSNLLIASASPLTPTSGDTPEGISEESAFKIIGTGIKALVYNTSVLNDNDGAYIKFEPAFMGSGNYTVTVLGEGATVEIVGGTAAPSSSVSFDAKYEIVGIESNVTQTPILIKAPSSTYLMIIITKN